MIKPLVWAAWSRFASVAARSYIVGPELSDAVRVCRRLAAAREAATVCYWNVPEDGSRRVVDAYLEALEALAALSVDAYLSIKAPAFGFDRALLAPVSEAARRHRLGLHFDSLAPEATDRTMELIQRLLAEGLELGCTLPSRWRRSLEDADWAVRYGLSVRVVKGQWADPVHPDGSPEELRQDYLAVIDRLAGRARMVRVATHDAPLAQEAFGRLRQAGTACEQELLFGLPMGPSRRVAQAAGVPVRQYLPYGHGWLPYCLSQLASHPRLGWWVLRDLCTLPFSHRQC
jgi:proline dehydrogenase